MAKPITKQEELYFIVSLCKDRISLMSVSGAQLTDIKDTNFPMVYLDDFEYSRSVIGTSFGYSSKGFEKDKSALKKTRFTSFLQTADKHLNDYIGTHPLILAGIDRHLSDFRRITRHSKNIIGEVKGSYTDYNRQRLLKASREIFGAPKKA